MACANLRIVNKIDNSINAYNSLNTLATLVQHLFM